MRYKLKNIHLAIIPALFLITLVCSLVALCTKSDSQNRYGFLGQLVLVAVWIFANLGLKKILRIKVLAIVLANAIFQVLLFAHILIYLFSVMQATDYNLGEYLACGYIAIGLVATGIMIHDLVESVGHINLLKQEICLEPDEITKLNKIFVAAIPALCVWSLIYSFIMLAFDMMYIVFNGLGLLLLIGIWLGMNFALRKCVNNKKSLLIISHIVFQFFTWAFVVCCIVLTALGLNVSIAGGIYQCISLCVISLSALVVMRIQLKSNIQLH